ncbi:hypothetical protein K5E_25380 [Enterococcus thailandicus]|uniref:hypothetical protein n=1 Tax=Enterococcus thailandicus TaxID=417368 RepID=UPI00244D8E44|nr:hypothetical protein [Enterococcus thailandicus]GMC10399.1 hypothetical protein K5E_25380 [Enterococcus thailandicus]
MATWSESDLDYLKNNYGKIASEEIAKYLKRSSNSIRHKAQRMGLAEKRNFWDEDEEIYLEYFALEKDSNLEAAADFLGRSVNSVQLHLSLIRNKRKDYYANRIWTSQEDEYIRKHHKSYSYKVIAHNIGRSHKAVGERARQLELRKKQSLESMDKEIRRLASEGTCPADIARMLHVKYASLHDYLKKHDISYKPLTTEESLERARKKSPWHTYNFFG